MEKWIKEEAERLRETKTPRCHICKKDYVNAVDSITGKVSEYLWEQDCRCYRPKLMISFG